MKASLTKPQMQFANAVVGYETELNEIKLGWFPVTGDSMTNVFHQYSIPDGSWVLAKALTIRNVLDYPLNTPPLIEGELPNGTTFFICKTISFIDSCFNHAVQLKSYNSQHKNCWISIHFIKKVFTVEMIKKPNAKTISVRHHYH